MATEVFYRMRSSVLTTEVQGFGTVADALARWHSDPWYDGPDIVALLEGFGAVQSWYGKLGSLDPEVLGFPPRVIARMDAVQLERGPWPTHRQEPEAFRDLLGILWVSHDELRDAWDAMADAVARGFAGCAPYETDPDAWFRDLGPWLEPVGSDEIEVWLFQIDEPEEGERGRPWAPPEPLYEPDPEFVEPPLELRPHRAWDVLPWVLLAGVLVVTGMVFYLP